MLLALKNLKKYRSKGIGGRDCLIISTMSSHNVNILVTHDKNLLKSTQFKRIDPVFNPPMILEKNKPLNLEEFKEIT